MSEDAGVATMEGAQASAMERLNSLPPPEQPPSEPPPDETPPSEPAPGEPADKAWAPPDRWEIDIDGQRHTVRPEEVDYIIRQYARALRQSQARQAQTAEPARETPKGETPGTPDNPLMKELKALQERLDGMERSTAEERDRMRQENLFNATQGAIEGDPLLRELAKDEEVRAMLIAHAVAKLHTSPDMSPQSAAAEVARIFEKKVLNPKISAYVRSKIEQAKAKVDGAGVGNVPQKKLDGKDIKNGNVMKRVMDRLTRMGAS